MLAAQALSHLPGVSPARGTGRAATPSLLKIADWDLGPSTASKPADGPDWMATGRIIWHRTPDDGADKGFMADVSRMNIRETPPRERAVI